MAGKKGRGGPNKGKGKHRKWLLDRANYQGDECLIWPFYRLPNGYAMFGCFGKMHYAHRYMCELVNGAPPPRYEAAHSCGNGHSGCVHPKHLSWKTKTANRRDSIGHGTSIRNTRGKRGILTPDQVITIRSLKGVETQDKIAARFGVSAPTIRAIYAGKIYRSVLDLNPR